MLQELAKHHNQLIKIAVKFTGSLDLANDVVQDAYLKLFDSGKKFEEINDSYIYFTIKSIWLDTKKQSSVKNRTILVDEFPNLIEEEDIEVHYELNDITHWERLLIDAVCGRVITNDNNEIVKHIKGTTIMDLSKKTGIQYSVLYRGIKNLKQKVCLKD